jgi:hypothetical protein
LSKSEDAWSVPLAMMSMVVKTRGFMKTVIGTLLLSVCKHSIGHYFGRSRNRKSRIHERDNPDVPNPTQRREDGCEPDANGMLPPVDNTVDIENANWTNTIVHQNSARSGPIPISILPSASSTTPG